jgi:apolipoprotein N-acyltransferase
MLHHKAIFENIYLYIAYTLSGALMGIGFIFTHFWWSTFLGVTVLYVVYNKSNSLSVFLYGSILAGTIKGIVAFSFLSTVIPIDWAPENSLAIQILFVCCVWFLSACAIGSGLCVTGFIFWVTRNTLTAIAAPLQIIALVIGEIVGSIIWSIVFFEPLFTSIHSHFGYAMTGYTFAYHELLRATAIFGGIYSLTLVLSALSYTLAIFLGQCSRKNVLPTSTAIIGFFLAFFYTAYISKTTSQKLPTSEDQTIHQVAAIATNFDTHSYKDTLKNKIIQEELELSILSALSHDIDVVALPEDARFTTDKSDAEVFQWIRAHTLNPTVVLVDSMTAREGVGKTTLRGVIFDSFTETTSWSNKATLVPMGEYVPLIFELPIAFLHIAHYFAHMSYSESVSRKYASEFHPSILYCFESSSPTLSKQKAHESSSPLIIHPVSHAWFHNPHALWNQENQMLIVQALYSGRSILQVGNKAPTKLYTPNGVAKEGLLVSETSDTKVLIFEYMSQERQ